MQKETFIEQIPRLTHPNPCIQAHIPLEPTVWLVVAYRRQFLNYESSEALDVRAAHHACTVVTQLIARPAIS